MSIFSFNPFPNKPWFLHVCSTSLLKTQWKKEKLLVTSNFSFSHGVFYQFGELSSILIKFEINVCKLVQFGRVLNLLLGKGLTLSAQSKNVQEIIYGFSNSLYYNSMTKTNLELYKLCINISFRYKKLQRQKKKLKIPK